VRRAEKSEEDEGCFEQSMSTWMIRRKVIVASLVDVFKRGGAVHVSGCPHFERSRVEDGACDYHPEEGLTCSSSDRARPGLRGRICFVEKLNFID